MSSQDCYSLGKFGLFRDNVLGAEKIYHSHSDQCSAYIRICFHRTPEYAGVTNTQIHRILVDFRGFNYTRLNSV